MHELRCLDSQLGVLLDGYVLVLFLSLTNPNAQGSKKMDPRQNRELWKFEAANHGEEETVTSLEYPRLVWVSIFFTYLVAVIIKTYSVTYKDYPIFM